MFRIFFHNELKIDEAKNAETIQPLPKILILFESDEITEILITSNTCLV